MTTADLHDITDRFCDGLGRRWSVGQVWSAVDNLISALEVADQVPARHPHETAETTGWVG